MEIDTTMDGLSDHSQKNVKSTVIVRLLTYNIQVNKMAYVRCRRQLTFVDSAVTLLWVLDLQHPFIRVGIVHCTKTLIGCVGVTANGQQVNVSMTDPGNLSQHLGKTFEQKENN
jgi:hypothetical protein